VNAETNLGAHRLAGVALALIVLAFQLMVIQRACDGATDTAPGVLLELVLPGAFADAGSPRGPVPGTTTPPPRPNLMARTLIPTARAPARASLYVGLLPLLLAIMAAISAQGRWPTRARIGLVIGVILVGGGIPTGLIGALLLIASLAVLAGLGLTGLSHETEGSSAPTLALGSASVVLAAVLGALALQAGAVPDPEVTGPLVRRLPAGEEPAWSATMLAASAAHLRFVLDRAALAAFAGMTALLLHLKGRARWSLALIVLVVIADLLTARFA